jgi:hypothetical protein
VDGVCVVGPLLDSPNVMVVRRTVCGIGLKAATDRRALPTAGYRWPGRLPAGSPESLSVRRDAPWLGSHDAMIVAAGPDGWSAGGICRDLDSHQVNCGGRER